MLTLKRKKFDPSVKVFKVVKNFLFEEDSYQLGDDFIPEEHGAIPRRVRLLYEQRYIDVKGD